MIRISNLKFSYKRSQRLFDSLSLELPAGHIYGLLGKNGEGKSTLLKLLSGVLFPQGGQIESLGVMPTKREPSFLSQIYYIPEEIFSTKYSINRYVAIMSQFYPNFNHEEFNDYIEEFGLERGERVSSMSLGQKKKFAIAFGLACNSKLLIMDEPTNGLDIPSKSQFRKVVSKIVNQERTVIISTHQVRDLDNLIDSIVVMNGGQIIINSTIESIAQQLNFKQLAPTDEPLYEERNSMSRCGIVKSSGEECCKVDIEMLFNAAIATPSNICRILNQVE